MGGYEGLGVAYHGYNTSSTLAGIKNIMKVMGNVIKYQRKKLNNF